MAHARSYHPAPAVSNYIVWMGQEMKASELRDFIVENAFITHEKYCNSWRNIATQEIKVFYKGKLYAIKKEVTFALDDNSIDKLIELIGGEDESE